MTEEQNRLLSRLMKTSDGKEFVDEILRPMLLENHRNLLNSSKEFRDELIGFGGCIEHLVGLFENCDTKLKTKPQDDDPNIDWT
jgi:hypothetical protein